MTVRADPSVCIGAGLCALRAPEVFDQSEEDGTVVVLDAEPGAVHDEAVAEAVALCPSGALAVSSPSPPAAGPAGRRPAG